jgi:hypothetical protein
MQTINIAIPTDAADSVVVKTVEQAARAISLTTTLRTSTRSYPDSVHWHFKKQAEKRGTLELTYWPQKRKLWAKIQSGRTAEWISASLNQLKVEITHRLSR